MLKRSLDGADARVLITTGPSQTGHAMQERLAARLREARATGFSQPDVMRLGTGSPKAAGF